MKIEIDEKELKEILKLEFRRMWWLTNLNEKQFSFMITNRLKEYTKFKKGKCKKLKFV